MLQAISFCSLADGWAEALLYILACSYLFLGMAMVCEEYFVVALDCLVQNLKITSDVAGATFMAAGTSAPELCVAIFGVVVSSIGRGGPSSGTSSDTAAGVGTVVGSLVFNSLVIVGGSALVAPQPVHLDITVMLRDAVFYALALVLLWFCLSDEQVTWIDSLLMVGAYVLYILVNIYFQPLRKWLKRIFCGRICYPGGSTVSQQKKSLLECAVVGIASSEVSSVGKKSFTHSLSLPERDGPYIFETKLDVDVQKDYHFSWESKWQTSSSSSSSTSLQQAEDSQRKKVLASDLATGYHLFLHRRRNIALSFMGWSEDEQEERDLLDLQHEVEMSPTLSSMKVELSRITPTLIFSIPRAQQQRVKRAFQAADVGGKGYLIPPELLTTFHSLRVCQKYRGDLRKALQLSGGTVTHFGYFAPTFYMWSSFCCELNQRFCISTQEQERIDAFASDHSLQTQSVDSLDQIMIEKLCGQFSDERLVQGTFLDRKDTKAMIEMIDGTVTLQEVLGLCVQFQVFKRARKDHSISLGRYMHFMEGRRSVFLSRCQPESDLSITDQRLSSSFLSSCGSGLRLSLLNDAAIAGSLVEYSRLSRISVLAPPSSIGSKILFYLGLPFSLAFAFTIPDCTKPKWKVWYPATLCLSMLWIGVLVCVMMQWAEKAACLLGISESFMGLTFCAAGTSFPDMLASLCVARDGEGLMAVSNAFGSNTFDILFGLGLPFLLVTACLHPRSVIPVPIGEISLSVVLLMLLLVLQLILLFISRCKLYPYHGVILLTGYLLYVVYCVCQLFV